MNATPSFNVVIDGKEAKFEDTSTTNNSTFIEDWFWNFGDGTTSNEQNPCHTYSNTASYNVTLEIKGTTVIEGEEQLFTESVTDVITIIIDCEVLRYWTVVLDGLCAPNLVCSDC